MSNLLEIRNLHVEVDGQPILKGIDMDLEPGKIHAIMGPNGSGKSSLVMSLMGHPKYEITDGTVNFNGKDLLEMEVDERNLNGMFVAFQHPREMEGVNLATFLHTMYNSHQSHSDESYKPLSVFKFKKMMKEMMAQLKVNPNFLDRSLNHGFSGGEKKKIEILQMALAEPKLAMLDEIDSGLDVDALRSVCESVTAYHQESGMAVLMVTHYTRILRYIEPDVIHVLKDGKVVKSGGKDFAHELEEHGYENL